MSERLRREARAGDVEAISKLLRAHVRKNDPASLAETLALWRRRDPIAIARWLASSKNGVAWPMRPALIEASREHSPLLAADVHDLFGEEAPLALITPGAFLMGSPKDERGRKKDEHQHEVEITQYFLLGKTPVTQKQWRAVMGNNPSRFEGNHRPVESVDWFEANDYCDKISASARVHAPYRLPTEAEWEYAYRASTHAAFYTGPWNQSAADPDLNAARIAWSVLDSGRKTHPVAEKEPNAWGLYDMAGNVCEWVSDWYDPDYYHSSPAQDPQGPSSGSYRTLRGGSYRDAGGHFRAAVRLYGYRDASRYNNVGFRCARSLETF